MNSRIIRTTLCLGACMIFPLGELPLAMAAPGTTMEIVQQTRKITGTVIDEFGDAVIGANVIEKGTTNGVMKIGRASCRERVLRLV